MAAIIVGGLGIAGLALVLLLLLKEPTTAYRVAAIGAAVFSLSISALIAFATGQEARNAVAIILLGTAVLPLVLLSQLRAIRTMTTSRRR